MYYKREWRPVLGVAKSRDTVMFCNVASLSITPSSLTAVNP
jgi:hypothetical protein